MATTSIFGSSRTPTSLRRPSTSNGSPSSRSESVSTSRFGGRKSSFSAGKSPKKRNNSQVVSLSPEKEKHNNSSSTKYSDNHPPPLPAPPPFRDESGARSAADSYVQVVESAEAIPPSPTDSFTSTTPYVNMLVRPGTGYQSIASNGAPPFTTLAPPSPTLETITYQHIQETSSKRISTLDYLRKASVVLPLLFIHKLTFLSHEGRVYWFNTLLFNKPDLQRMPYFDTRRLARRATNYLLLGLSLPTILDLNSSNPVEFLKTLNALLAEFESFQQMHPPDGSSSLSRGRFPQMFKRATATGGKGRRTSSAADIGLPMGNDTFDSKSANSNSSGNTNSASSFPISEFDLLPGEEYTYLLTPSLPFDPDFYETFATLCDVLIDCYTRLMSLVASPRECSPIVAEMFTKADARVRKIIVQGVVKEFEDSSRSGVKSEVAGVGRVVLGGLM